MHSGFSVHHENGNGGVFQNIAGDATENDFAQTAVRIGTHHQQTTILCVSVAQQGRSDTLAMRRYFIKEKPRRRGSRLHTGFSVLHEIGDGGVFQNMAGDTTQHDLAQAAVRIGAHDE